MSPEIEASVANAETLRATANEQTEGFDDGVETTDDGPEEEEEDDSGPEEEEEDDSGPEEEEVQE